jgi:hypothetical protein
MVHLLLLNNFVAFENVTSGNFALIILILELFDSLALLKSYPDVDLPVAVGVGFLSDYCAFFV